MEVIIFVRHILNCSATIFLLKERISTGISCLSEQAIKVSFFDEDSDGIFSRGLGDGFPSGSGHHIG